MNTMAMLDLDSGLREAVTLHETVDFELLLPTAQAKAKLIFGLLVPALQGRALEILRSTLPADSSLGNGYEV